MAKKISKEVEDIIVENYKNGKSPYWMVKNIECLKDKRANSIYDVLKRLGIETHRKITLTDEQRKNRRKYSVNDDYFEIIDTEEKAYWLGFLYADGWLRSDSDKIGLSLALEDKEHIEKFKKSLDSKSIIKVYEQKQGFNAGSYYARILITSSKMKKDLISNGMLEHKTEKITFPNFLNKNLYRHFIRGYFDGDGSITCGGYQVCGNKDFNIKIVGTKELLNSFKEILGVNTTLSQRHPDRNVNNYSITIGGNLQVRRIMDYLYKDSTIYLIRKYKKYEELIKQQSVV